MADSKIKKNLNIDQYNIVKSTLQTYTGKRSLLWFYDSYVDENNFHAFRLDINGTSKTIKYEEMNPGIDPINLITIANNVITGSITSTGSLVDLNIDLPSGYTVSNAVILSFGYSATMNAEYRYGNNAFGLNERVFARITPQGKIIVSSNYNGTIYYKIVIGSI